MIYMVWNISVNQRGKERKRVLNFSSRIFGIDYFYLLPKDSARVNEH